MGAQDKSKLPAGVERAAIEAFLEKARLAPVAPKPAEPKGRLIFALDATASREPSWDRASQIQGEMFEATAALGGLAVQLVYYRGFGECRASAWVTNSKDLVRQMARVFCLAGRTQIAKVLRHAIREAKTRKVGALVFVGDAMEENVDRLGQLAGELGLLGVKGFLFHEGRDPEAERAFRYIAKLTKGAYCRFDSGSARQLRDLLGAVAVYATGGAVALEDLSRRKGADVKRLSAQLRS